MGKCKAPAVQQTEREFSQDERCPHCGSETEVGFGLAGGGYGIYSYCPGCERVISKTQVEE